MNKQLSAKKRTANFLVKVIAAMIIVGALIAYYTNPRVTGAYFMHQNQSGTITIIFENND